MSKGKITKAVVLDDGRLLVEQPDGSFRVAESKSDWARLNAMTDKEVTAAAEADSDNPPLDKEFWKRAALRTPERKTGVFLRLDPDVLTWFRQSGRGYQTRINAVLRAYKEAKEPSAR
jgi:uncharacterized protein (DUF4415 family)